MIDYKFTTVSRYDGTTRTEKAIEVFNCVTGEAVAFCRRAPWEAKDKWIARALARAENV